MGHPALNPNVQNAAEALAKEGWLKEFHTGLDLSRLGRLRLGKLSEVAHRRALPEEVERLTTSHSAGEVLRLALARQRLIRTDPNTSRFSPAGRHAAMARILAARVLTGQFDAVYAYDDAALEAFEAAESTGTKRLLDLPTIYWGERRALLTEEANLNPAWASTIDALGDSPARLERKDAELQSADHVIVSSSFAARSLGPARAHGHAPVSVVPYGTSEVANFARRPSGPRLRVLFVGRLSQEKGLSYLFDAVEHLGGRVELTVVGDGRDIRNARLSRALAGCTWHRRLPRERVLQQMAAHDILVLPSISEAFGLVLTEALAVGTPFIASEHTGGPDLLARAGATTAPPGWVVPIRDAEAIAESLTRLADDPALRHAASTSALQLASNLRWTAYQRSVADIVRNTVSG